MLFSQANDYWEFHIVMEEKESILSNLFNHRKSSKNLGSCSNIFDF